MPTIIKMPAFSATMETAKLLSWLVKPGDSVAKGQVLAEIETDKAVATIESPEAGQVLQLLVAAGDEDVPVRTNLALLTLDGEPPTEPAAPPRGAAIVAGNPAAAGAAPRSQQRVRASPAARARARELGLDLSQIAGSGPHGRVQRADIRAPSAGVGTVKAADRAEQLRFSMARALVHAKTTVPHFYAEVDIGLDALLELRQQLSSDSQNQRSPTITAYLIRAAAVALQQVPAANRFWAGDSIAQRTTYHIGCAVGLPDRIAVPVVRAADRSSVEHIGKDLQRLTALARGDALTQKELGDASLTISNLGMHGIDRFFPIVNVPEPLILGIGRARKVVCVVDDLIGIRTVVSCTASVDHRVIDGELVGRFLQAFKGGIERPRLLVS